jgi:hypothetical protein
MQRVDGGWVNLQRFEKLIDKKVDVVQKHAEWLGKRVKIVPGARLERLTNW